MRRRNARLNPVLIWTTLSIATATWAAVATAAEPVETQTGLQVEHMVQAMKMPTPEPVQSQANQERTYYDVPLSRELQDAVFQAAEQRGVPAGLLLAMMDQESDYRADAVSGTGDYGIMQINTINHPRLREELGITDFMDPEQSIACGAFMIGELVDKYDGDLHRALTSYNRGETGARRYAERTGTYASTYSSAILEIYQQLEEGRE